MHGAEVSEGGHGGGAWLMRHGGSEGWGGGAEVKRGPMGEGQGLTRQGRCMHVWLRTEVKRAIPCRALLILLPHSH